MRAPPQAQGLVSEENVATLVDGRRALADVGSELPGVT